MANWLDDKRELTRRQVLRLLGGAGAGVVLLSYGGHRVLAQVSVPDSGAELPTENVTLRWVDSGDQKAVFWREFFAAYEQAHPNITIEYDPLPWTEIAQVVPLGIRNGTAHDVFQLPLSLSGVEAVQEGWVQPLDEHIPNFAEWKAKFPPGVFLPGITDFNGKTYGLPITSAKRYTTLLLYNVDYLQRAGYDPASEPLTWSTFREAAKKVTEQGNGAYYGFIIGGNQLPRWANAVRDLARMAGAVGGSGNQITSDINFLTGEYNFSTEEYIAAVELLLAMRDDGSVFPGTVSLNAPQSRGFMPQGASGMILQGSWNIPTWERENPDFNFGVSPLPRPDDREPMPLTISEGGTDVLWLYAESNVEAVAGDIFHYIGSLEGQTAWANVIAGDSPILPEAIEDADLSPRARQAVEIFNRQVRVGPNPLVRNPETSEVALELRTPEPSFAQVVQGLYTGQLTDVRAEMESLQERYTAELERAIAVAQERGANVSRDDWVFPNWNPEVDYGIEDYEALP